MAASRSSVIQMDDGQGAQAELQFQDFTLGGSDADVATFTPSGSYSPYKESLESSVDENEDLLGAENKEGPSSFWQFSYYQGFFDVDTDQVVQRIVWSMVPLPGRATFLDRQIRPKPDLYGPFWIAATLVFSTAICANIANYLTSEGQSAKIWSYDFHKVSFAATAIYSYSFLLPILLWGLMWYRQSSNRYSLLEILCVYGYSLAIYVPISVLWVIQVAWFQWILVIVGAALSGAVLLQTFWPIFRDENKKIAAVVLCLILLFHTLLAVGFVTYFFQPPSDGKSISPATIAPLPPTVSSPSSLKDASLPVSQLSSRSLVSDKEPLIDEAEREDTKKSLLLDNKNSFKPLNETTAETNTFKNIKNDHINVNSISYKS